MRRSKSSFLHKSTPSEEAFELFFRKNYASLCQGVYRLLKDEALAEDLVQEVFMKVWEKRNQLDFNDRFIFYLKRSCYHAALNYLSEKRYTHDTDGIGVLSERDEADNNILYSELEAEVRCAIGKLPEKTRLVFSLSRYEEMTYREIAHQLKISVKAVEKHMGIALKRLRNALKDHVICLALLLFS